MNRGATILTIYEKRCVKRGLAEFCVRGTGLLLGGLQQMPEESGSIIYSGSLALPASP